MGELGCPEHDALPSPVLMQLRCSEQILLQTQGLGVRFSGRKWNGRGWFNNRRGQRKRRRRPSFAGAYASEIQFCARPRLRPGRFIYI